MFFDHSSDFKLEITNRKISRKIDKIGTLLKHV